jgi:hypothetical protein
MSVGLERETDELGEERFIIDDENSHGSPPPRA